MQALNPNDVPAQILQGISRVPAKSLNNKTLKMCQVQITPDAKGFGIDLTDFNGVAGLREGSAASISDLHVGDIIVSVDGVDVGMRRLVELLQRGMQQYVFTVVRPTQMTTPATVRI